MEPLSRFAFVLFRPKNGGNIGAAARALKNMGFSDLRIVSTSPWDRRAAEAMAVHAGDLLDRAVVYPALAAAVDDCRLTVGTTCRSGRYRSGARHLREAAGELIGLSSENRVAIIFGPEDTGLTNRELKLCQRLVTIPSAPEYPSLNLAQAVMVTAYELMMAASSATRVRSGARKELAPAGAVDAMAERMAAALLAIGFLSGDNSDHIMFTLRAIFGRSALSPRDVDILSGIAHQIDWVARGGDAALEAKRRAGRKLR